MGKIIGSIVAVCIVLGIIGNCFGGSNDIPRSQIEDAVNKALSTDLTDPADSVFAPDSDVEISKNSDDVYNVNGYVDCANAFGGKVRNRYSANVKKNDDGSLNVTWILTNSITGQMDNGQNDEQVN